MRIRRIDLAAGLMACLYGTVTGAAVPSCVATSGARAAALVELYTSEGCDSCPPADRWLSSLGRSGQVPERVVPVSLHVDYWDYIGWKDPWAKREHTRRQQLLAKTRRSAIVYTPQVLLQGREYRQWGTADFDRRVQEINAQPARARIELRIESTSKESLSTEVVAELTEGKARPSAALYLASFENKLVSQVKSGENRGKTLEHDFVVLEWNGPFSFDANGRVREKRLLSLLPGGRAQHSGAVAFVQDRDTGEVLQALMLPLGSAPCSRT